MAKFSLGHHREATEAGCVRAVLAEAVLTFLFVFSGVGSAMAAGRLAGGTDTIMDLTAVALAHTMAVAVMVSAGLHVSGGHINPAVTLALAAGGHITLFRSALYVPPQLLGSSLACLLLSFLVGGAVAMPVHALAAGVGALGGRAHILAALHGVRYRPGPAPERRRPRPAASGPGSRRQRARRRAVLRRVHEPSTFVRAGACLWRVGWSLGLLGWPHDWWAACWGDLRGAVHGPGRPSATSKG